LRGDLFTTFWHWTFNSVSPTGFTKHPLSAMPSRKRGRKSRKPPTDPQPISSKPSTAITPAGADRQDLSELVASGSGAGLETETELGRLTLQARLDVTQAQIVASDIGRKGHTYENVVAKENARVQFGDVYNVYNSSQPSAKERVDSNGQELMKALFFDGMSDRLMSITPAYAETCSWILNRPEYLRWRDHGQRSSHHGVLWIKGKAGAGKSTMMSCLHDHDRQQDREGVTASFFFNARSSEKLVRSTEGMYRCLLYQILENLPRLRKSLLRLLQAPRSNEETWRIELLENAFRSIILDLSVDERVTCFVDALDECKIEDVRRAIDRFEDLAESVTTKNIQFRICFSSRYYPQITMRHHEELKLDAQPEHMQDIVRYVESKLTVPERAKPELSRKIYDRCSGVFLWVVLVVKRLKENSDSGSTHTQLLAILNAIPEELEDLFAKVVAEPDGALISILRWNLFSRRELSTQELYFAVQTSIGGTTTGYWDTTDINIDGMMRYLLQASRGLMEPNILFGEQSKWRGLSFIHESVREYFLSGGPASMGNNSSHGTYVAGHAKLAEECLSYLDLVVKNPNFLGLFDPTMVSQITKPVVPGTSLQRVRAISKLPLVKYASSNVLSHTEIAFANGKIHLRVLERLPLKHMIMFLKHGLKLQVLEFGHSWSLLYLLLRQDCPELARALLARTSRPSHSSTRTLCNNNDKSSTHTPLMKPDLGEGFGSLRPHLRPLHFAIRHGREGFVKLLLDCRADVDVKKDFGDRPLRFAVLLSHREFVRILFQYDVRVDAAGTKNVLHLAVRHASKDIAQWVLRKTGLNLADCVSHTPLHLTTGRPLHASNGDDGTIVRILLEAGADMEAADRDGNTVLIKAAGNSRIHLVRALLEEGANVHARNVFSFNALHAAVESHLTCQFRDSGWLDQELLPMLQALLDAGADINADGGSYDTVLNFACVDRDFELVRFLLDRGAVFARHGRQQDDHIAEFLSMANHHDGKGLWERQRWSPVSDT
jgi:ankyrin repeat protein